MLLAIDIGNTEITLGLFDADRLHAHWRLTAVENRTPDEWAAMVSGFLTQAGLSPNQVRAAVEASVAPAITDVFAEGVERTLGFQPTSIGPESALPVVLDVEEPLTVGADRVVNALAASQLYRRDTIVVDLGTATSFDCVTGDGRFLGGVIAPGLKTGADNLIRRAAKLPATELKVPDRVIGRRTEDCIRAGVLFGAVDAIDGIVRRIKAEWPAGAAPYVVGTGGLVTLVLPISREIEHHEPRLTLLGLRLAARHVGLAW